VTPEEVDAMLAESFRRLKGPAAAAYDVAKAQSEQLLQATASEAYVDAPRDAEGEVLVEQQRSQEEPAGAKGRAGGVGGSRSGGGDTLTHQEAVEAYFAYFTGGSVEKRGSRRGGDGGGGGERQLSAGNAGVAGVSPLSASGAAAGKGGCGGKAGGLRVGQESVFPARRLTVSRCGERCQMARGAELACGSRAIGLTANTTPKCMLPDVFTVKPIACEPQAVSAALSIGHLAPRLETVNLRA
jgi:hypothetical protein